MTLRPQAGTFPRWRPTLPQSSESCSGSLGSSVCAPCADPIRLAAERTLEEATDCSTLALAIALWKSLTSAVEPTGRG